LNLHAITETGKVDRTARTSTSNWVESGRCTALDFNGHISHLAAGFTSPREGIRSSGSSTASPAVKSALGKRSAPLRPTPRSDGLRISRTAKPRERLKSLTKSPSSMNRNYAGSRASCSASARKATSSARTSSTWATRSRTTRCCAWTWGTTTRQRASRTKSPP
jgi:hypothetical protein